MPFTAQRQRTQRKRRALGTDQVRGGMGGESREECPHEWGRPRGAPRLEGCATVPRRRINGLRRERQEERRGRKVILPPVVCPPLPNCGWRRIGRPRRRGAGCRRRRFYRGHTT